jgi:hypothetical protein
MAPREFGVKKVKVQPPYGSPGLKDKLQGGNKGLLHNHVAEKVVPAANRSDKNRRDNTLGKAHYAGVFLNGFGQAFEPFFRLFA